MITMKDFKELLMKKAKEGKFLSDEDKDAKMEVVRAVKQMASEEMGDELKNLKGMGKVTVASDSPEGLKAGLEKAEDVVEEKLANSEESEDSEEEMPMHEPKMKMAGMSKEEKIKKLEEELAMLKGESEEEAMA